MPAWQRKAPFLCVHSFHIPSEQVVQFQTWLLDVAHVSKPVLIKCHWKSSDKAQFFFPDTSGVVLLCWNYRAVCRRRWWPSLLIPALYNPQRDPFPVSPSLFHTRKGILPINRHWEGERTLGCDQVKLSSSLSSGGEGMPMTNPKSTQILMQEL